jgi:hypothetical protein
MPSDNAPKPQISLKLVHDILQKMRLPKVRIQRNTGSENFDIPEEYRSRISVGITNGEILSRIDNIVFALNAFVTKTDNVNGVFRFDKSEKMLRYFADIDLKGGLAQVEMTIEDFAKLHGISLADQRIKN